MRSQGSLKENFSAPLRSHPAHNVSKQQVTEKAASRGYLVGFKMG